MKVLPNRRGGDSRGYEEYDFGPVLARGQTLSHEFTFTNTTKQPLHLTEAIALTPCCSQVGPLPKSPIPRGGRCSIPVLWKIGANERETQRVDFVVQTDRKDLPSLRYSLRATIYPEWEARVSEESTRSLAPGRVGRQLIQITGRRVSGEGRGIPDQVEAEPPLVARFLGQPREKTEADGITTTVREVEITLPPSTRPGSRQGTIRFRWDEGRTQEQRVLWDVVAPVRASPGSLVLKRSEKDFPCTIVLRSDGRPFRITGVDPLPLLGSPEFSQGPGATQTLKLRLDPDRLAREPDPKITIHTDHPEQPTVSLSVFVLSTGV